MKNHQFHTFDYISSGLNTIKEEEASIIGNSPIDDEIRYMTDLKQLIQHKVKELNQDSNYK